MDGNKPDLHSEGIKYEILTRDYLRGFGYQGGASRGSCIGGCWAFLAKKFKIQCHYSSWAWDWVGFVENVYMKNKCTSTMIKKR
jgi:hypothetical protein